MAFRCYALDSSTGAVSEVATSPYQASTGQFGVLGVAESSGQFVYLVKSDLLAAPSTSTLTLDTFHVDTATPRAGAGEQPAVASPGCVGGRRGGGRAERPRHRNPDQPVPYATNAVSHALLYRITFDPVTGVAALDPKRRNGGWQPRIGLPDQRAWKFPGPLERREPRIAFHLPDQCDEFRADTSGD